MVTNIEILKRLYTDYTSKYLKKIFLSVFFSLLLAGSTSSIAYLLDPALKIIYRSRSKLYYHYPLANNYSFFVKGGSLYLAKVLMINVSEEVRKDFTN